MAIDSLQAVYLGRTTQWIRVRGADEANPVLLLIQLGPGLPMINEARRFEALLGLEEFFTVVYWDQRGCGRSLRKQIHPYDVTLEAMVGDTVALLELLHDRLGSRPHVAGFSLGGTVGAYAAAERPDLVSTLVTAGIEIDGTSGATAAYDFALGVAHERGNRRALGQLQAIGSPPHLVGSQFSTRARWVMNFGGVTTSETYASLGRELLASLVRSPDYSAADIVRTLRGITTIPAALLRDTADLDLVHELPRIDVPVVFVQGRHDKVAPGEVAEQYASVLSAPSKRLVWFEESAHTPHLEEPDKFRALLLEVRAEVQGVDARRG
jgi:pimeloyl-ACP methyl ester carboxylesterase